MCADRCRAPQAMGIIQGRLAYGPSVDRGPTVWYLMIEGKRSGRRGYRESSSVFPMVASCRGPFTGGFGGYLQVRRPRWSGPFLEREEGPSISTRGPGGKGNERETPPWRG